jgi:hypothetical protein
MNFFGMISIPPIKPGKEFKGWREVSFELQMWMSLTSRLRVLTIHLGKACSFERFSKRPVSGTALKAPYFYCPRAILIQSFTVHPSSGIGIRGD